MDPVKRSITDERVYTIDTGEPLYYEVLGVTELGEKNAQPDRQRVTVCDGRDFAPIRRSTTQRPRPEEAPRRAF